MATTLRQYQIKIKKVLDKFVNPTLSAEIDIYLEEFLNKLACQDETDDASLLSLPVFMEWTTKTVTTWQSKETAPSTNVSCFVLNLAGLLMKNEERFRFLNNDNFILKLLTVLKVREPEAVPAVKMAYIRLLSSFVQHKSGIEWIIFYGFWEHVFELGVTEQNGRVVEESCKFLSKFLESTIDCDQNFSVKIVKRMMVPLNENIQRSLIASADLGDLADARGSRNMEGSLKLIGNVLEYFLENVLYREGDFRVLLIFFKHFNLEKRISDLILLAKNRCLVFDLGKVMFIMQFLELYVNVIGKRVSLAASLDSIKKIKNNFVINICKVNFEDVLKFCNFGHLYWKLMAANIPSFQISEKSKIFSFADQFVVMELIPCFCFILQYKQPRSHRAQSNVTYEEFEDLFVDKLVHMCSPEVFRQIYIYRDYLTTFPNFLDICIISLTNIKKARKHFSKQRAVIVFQVLVYILRGSANHLQQSSNLLHIFLSKFQYFLLMFELLQILIDEFEISWKDSFETIDVMAVSFDFLTQSGWPTKLLVQALSLLKTSIVKYMTPNLALLVDRTADSTIDLLGPLLFDKLHDDVVDIRKAALDVVCSMIKVSGKKFPSLQKVLLDSKLLPLVNEMSTAVEHDVVRAAAIKCLQEVVQIEDLCNSSLNTKDLSQTMKGLLLNDPAADVRKEAATFVCIAYNHQQIPKDILDKVYVAMIHAATNDVHWEVKVRALHFWEKVIQDHLQNEGMIDGSFPEVTFSKEHRKIITLTNSEIRKRLRKVLDRLGAMGCLWVLVSIIKNDTDLEVSKTALEITQNLTALFKKHNFHGEADAPKAGIMPKKSSSFMDYDDLIDQNFCWKSNDSQTISGVTCDDFLQFVLQDLNDLIKERSRWSKGNEEFRSFLDKVLKTYDYAENKKVVLV